MLPFVGCVFFLGVGEDAKLGPLNLIVNSIIVFLSLSAQMLLSGVYSIIVFLCLSAQMLLSGVYYIFYLVHPGLLLLFGL